MALIPSQSPEYQSRVHSAISVPFSVILTCSHFPLLNTHSLMLQSDGTDSGPSNNVYP